MRCSSWRNPLLSLASYLPSTAVGVVELRCRISSGRRTVSREHSLLPLQKMTQRFRSLPADPTVLVWARFPQRSPRAGVGFTPRRQPAEEATGQSCCAMVLSDDAFTDRCGVCFYMKLPLRTKPRVGHRGWRPATDSFPKPGPCCSDSGWRVSPRVWHPRRGPLPQPCGTPGLRTSQTWARHPGRCSSAGRGAEAHPVVRSPMHREETGARYSFSFLLPYIISSPSISSGEITSKP